jgi:hypothetical protein
MEPPLSALPVPAAGMMLGKILTLNTSHQPTQLGFQVGFVKVKSSCTDSLLHPDGMNMRVGCIHIIISSQWAAYVNTLAKTTCKAEQRRMLTRGPPVNISDKTALPCPDDGEVYSLWYMDSPNIEQSAKLEGSLTDQVVLNPLFV